MHELTEITLVVLTALIMGLAFTRAKQPALVGYILAGVILGPSVFGLIEEREYVTVLAELGVIMLLFLIGLELSLKAFKAVWVVATSFVLIHLVCTYAVISLISLFFKWSWIVSFLVSCALSLSSTAVAVKMLEDIHELRTSVGRLTVGILIAQDLAIIPILLLTKSAATHHWTPLVLFKLLAAVGILGGVIWFLNHREKIRIPFYTLLKGNQELLSFTSLACCFGTASISGLLGLSPAYGAFLGGLIIGNSGLRTQLVSVTQPIQLLLLMIFFLSIGLLLDLQYIWHNIWQILSFLILLTVGKTALNMVILRIFRVEGNVAFLASLALAQMGEFSFLLANTGLQMAILTAEETKFIISLTVLSLIISPLWLKAARRFEEQAQPHSHSVRKIVSHVFDDEIATAKQYCQPLYHTLQHWWRSMRER